MPGAADAVGDVAQAFLTAMDTALQRNWREEDRGFRTEDRVWRKEDMAWRDEERDWRAKEESWRQENKRWRKQDMEQRVLENARWIWTRNVEKNRRDVEEKSEQLKSLSNLAALIAGFALASITQVSYFQSEYIPPIPEPLIGAYAATTAVTVGARGTTELVSPLGFTHLDNAFSSSSTSSSSSASSCSTFAHTLQKKSPRSRRAGLALNSMILCSFILSSILRNGKTYVSEEEESEFLTRCRRFALHYQTGDSPPVPKRTFEKYWETRCEEVRQPRLFVFFFSHD